MLYLGWALFFLSYFMGAVALNGVTNNKYERLPNWAVVFWLPVVTYFFVGAVWQVTIQRIQKGTQE